MGYNMADRRVGLNLQDARAVLRALAKFHAGTQALLQQNQIEPYMFPLFRMATDSNIIKSFPAKAFRNLAEVMETHWGPEWYIFTTYMVLANARSGLTLGMSLLSFMLT